MQEQMDALRAAHRTLAEAKARAEAAALNLDRARGSEAVADADLGRWREGQQTRETAHEAAVTAAIAAGESAPPYAHDVAVTAERERLEAHQRAVSQARGQFEREHTAALEAVKAAQHAVGVAARPVLLEEAMELVRRRRAMLSELQELDGRLRAFELTGGDLPPRESYDRWRIPTNILNEMAIEQLDEPERERRRPHAYTADWQRRRAQLIAGTELDSPAASEAAA